MSDPSGDPEQAPDGLNGEPAPPDEAPLEPPPRRPPARVQPVVVPRWIQGIVVLVSLFAVWGLAEAAGPVLLIFLVAAVIALILNPLVKLVAARRLPNGLAVGLVYLGLLAAIAGAIALLVNPVANQVEAFQENVPQLVRSANRSLANLQDWLQDRGINIEIKRQGKTALETLRDDVLRSSGDVVSFTRDLLKTLIEAAFALVLVVVISIYMLLYSDRVGTLARRIMPPGDGTPEDDYPTRVQKAVFGYVRGQLTFSLIMGVSAGVSLWLMGLVGIFPDGKTYALFFGAFYGLMEMIPYVGPVLGAAPPVLVALFQEPLTAVWLVILFIALQQLEGHVVAPQVFGHHLRINPLLVIFALLFGARLYGIVGALLALPLAAVARETVVYLSEHLVLEPWGTPSAAAIARAGVGKADPEDSTRCPECGAPIEAGDAFCAACGSGLRAELGSRG